jgi:hypothetical protein
VCSHRDPSGSRTRASKLRMGAPGAPIRVSAGAGAAGPRGSRTLPACAARVRMPRSQHSLVSDLPRPRAPCTGRCRPADRASRRARVLRISRSPRLSRCARRLRARAAERRSRRCAAATRQPRRRRVRLECCAGATPSVERPDA